MSNIAFSKHTLKNGLRIVLAPRPSSVSVAIGIFVGAGSRHEKKEQSGLAHFLEHMAFKRTNKYPDKMAIARKVEGMGGYHNASTGVEITQYYISVRDKFFTQALDILEETVFHSLFRKEDLEMEKGVVLEEIKMYQDDPKEWVEILVDQLVWPKHPLGRFIAGTYETVKSLRRESLLVYLQNFYSPQKIIVGVAGKFNKEKVLDEIAKRLRGLKPFKPQKFENVQEDQKAARFVLEKRSTEQTNFCLNFRAYPYKHPDRYAEGILAAILGAGMSSRLFKEIREERGLAYAVSAGAHYYYDTGVVQIYEGVDNRKVEKALRVTIDEVNKLRHEDVGDEELTKIKEYIKGILALQLESNSNVINWLVGQELFLDEILTYREYCQRVDSVTAKDVQRVAEDLFVNDRVNLALIGPFEEEGRFRRLLDVG